MRNLSSFFFQSWWSIYGIQLVEQIGDTESIFNKTWMARRSSFNTHAALLWSYHGRNDRQASITNLTWKNRVDLKIQNYKYSRPGEQPKVDELGTVTVMVGVCRGENCGVIFRGILGADSTRKELAQSL